MNESDLKTPARKIPVFYGKSKDKRLVWPQKWKPMNNTPMAINAAQSEFRLYRHVDDGPTER